MEASTVEKAKIRRWILMAAENAKDRTGVTIQQIKKFLDSKQNGLAMRPEVKLILNKVLETGHLVKKDGKYVIKKSKKTTPGQAIKRSKSPLKPLGRGKENKLHSNDEKSKKQKVEDEKE